MNELTPIQKLDTILNFLATNPKAKGLNSEGDLYKWFTDSYAENIDMGTFVKILNKLYDNKYVDRELKYNVYHYSISLEGEVFNLQGGYEKLEDRKSKAANLQSWQTWVIAVGTGLAGIYGLYELIKSIC